MGGTLGLRRHGPDKVWLLPSQWRYGNGDGIDVYIQSDEGSAQPRRCLGVLGFSGASDRRTSAA